MKVKTLHGVCKLASRISNPSSLTSLYRSIQLDNVSLRCCSEFGNIQMFISGGTGLENPVLLDCDSLMAIVQSLPQDEEIVFEEKTNKLHWSSGGNVKGHLNFVQTDHPILPITHTNFPWIPPDDLGNALLLAKSACQAAAVSVGLYGITIEPDGDKLEFFSSNTLTLAATQVEKGSYPAQKVTVRPPVPEIIATILATCPNCTLDVCDDGIFITGDWLVAQLPLGNNLDHDLKQLAQKYSGRKEMAAIDSIAVKKFISRARNLTEKSANFTVALKVENGKLTLTHAGIGSSTEQWFIAEGLPSTVNYEFVKLPADMLMVPLEFVQHVVLDYLKDSHIVLRGENPNFVYVVGGG